MFASTLLLANMTQACYTSRLRFTSNKAYDFNIAKVGIFTTLDSCGVEVNCERRVRRFT